MTTGYVISNFEEYNPIKFFIMKKLQLFMNLLFAFAIAGVFAQANQNLNLQLGVNNSAEVEQIGTANINASFQTFMDNGTNIAQLGATNVALELQLGVGNWA